MEQEVKTISKRLEPKQALEYVINNYGYTKTWFYDHISKIKRGGRYNPVLIDKYIEQYEDQSWQQSTKEQMVKARTGGVTFQSKTRKQRKPQSSNKVLEQVTNMLRNSSQTS